MLKKIIMTILTLAIGMAVLTGCSSDPVQDDLINYINNEVSTLVETENSVTEEYSAIIENSEATDIEFAAKLKDVIIPASEELVAQAKAIVPETEEVAAVHNKYVEAVTEQNEGFVLFLQATQKNNELVEYSTNSEMLTLINLEDAISTEFQTATTGSDEALAASLKNSIIPNSNELLEKSKAIVLETEEIATIHSKYIEANTELSEAFTLLLKAIEDNDSDALDTINDKINNSINLSDEYLSAVKDMVDDTTLLDSANEKLTNANKLSEEYLSDLDALKVEHNVEDEE
ncbi:hypothetical protein [Clostridium sp. DL1XJH146]